VVRQVANLACLSAFPNGDEPLQSSEIRASHKEVEQFVGKLEGFCGSLDPAGQAMLGTILEERNRAIRVGTSLGPGATGTRSRVARVRSRKSRGRMTWEGG
jgi:hypothetical protein